jgi:hypothetical protein
MMRRFSFITRSLSKKVGKIHTAISSYYICIAISRFIASKKTMCKCLKHEHSGVVVVSDLLERFDG